LEIAIRDGIAFIAAIMQPYEDIPNILGMKVIKDVLDLETGATRNVIVRTIIEDFWNEIIEVAERPNKQMCVCAMGAPVIGKSASTAILIRMLLQRNRTVFYHIRTVCEDGWVYKFTPVPTTGENPLVVYVIAICEKQFRHSQVERHRDDKGKKNYYVVDPGETKDTCCPSRGFHQHFILVSTPDKRHWGDSSFQKEIGSTRGTFRYFPIWNLEELLAARPYINMDISHEEVQRRHYLVGGVPGHVFLDPDELDDILVAHSRAINSLNDRQLEEMAMDGWPTMILLPYIPSKSALVGFDGFPCKPSDERNVVPISEMVRAKVFEKCQKIFWNDLVTRTVSKEFEHMALEKLGINAMHGAPYWTYCKQQFLKKNASLLKVELGGSSRPKHRQFRNENVISSATETENVLCRRTPGSTFEWVAFAYRKDNVFFAFHVTGRQVLKVDALEIRKFAKIVGGPQNLRLYFLVPAYNFDTFVAKPANTVTRIKQLIQQDIDTVMNEIEKLKSSEEDAVDTVLQLAELEGKVAQLQNELNSEWLIYVAMIKDPNKVYEDLG
jgi:hypothetical protein